MKTSPTQLSLRYLRAQGYTVAVVEHWNPFAQKRQDLFNFIDLLALKPGEIVAIQTTTRPNLSARHQKIQAEPFARAWLAAGGRIHLHGWQKNKKSLRYELLEKEEIS
jgi:hypothetical protein